jgi:uncharacterized protein (TIGR02466 family)
MTITVKREFKLMFATLVLERQLAGVDDLNRRLAKTILQRETEQPSIVRSNVGGWHSETDFWRWQAPEVAELFEHVSGAVKDYTAVERKVDAAALELTVAAEAWANVARAGHYAKPHVHPNSNVSGVYYVDAGSAPPGALDSGVLEVMDPRNRPGMFQTEGTLAFDAYRITPRSGLLVLFPAWVYHYVHPYQGKTPRICVAFNFTLQGLKIAAAP